ncbi:MAG: hypothetical protein LC135_04060 [Phycisphaerae bacterium]|nr:hypothetical protein [Phycisphaerae bacterium]MCZ2399026.1 hypothetical protein [Phycisphaerae bacterium]NUQ48846.1 hypothetical protein [Phycisphaerae bacterium]
MRRLFLLCTAISIVALPGLAPGQSQGIEWQRDVAAAVALAKRTERPLMFYVVGSTSDRPDEVEKDQRRSFRDARVMQQAKRFVTVRLARSQHRAELQNWGVNPNANLDVIFVRPDGTRIDQISASGAGIPESFAQKMAMVFNQYRNEVFAQKLRPMLDNSEATARDIRTALKQIDDFLILAADGTLAALLEREKLDPSVKPDIYRTLAGLSTPAAVDALLKAARSGDPNAIKVLDDCTPEAAERLLEDVGSSDPARHLLAYKTVTKICRLKNVKPDKFWDGVNQRVKDEEIERVRTEVRRIASRWKEQNEWR